MDARVPCRDSQGSSKDRYAEKNRIPVEEWRSPEERGLCLHSGAWEQPPERALDRRPDPGTLPSTQELEGRSEALRRRLREER